MIEAIVLSFPMQLLLLKLYFCKFLTRVIVLFSYSQTVLTRRNIYTGIEYRDDPTIFAWELINEPRCMTDPSGDTLQVSFRLSSHFDVIVLNRKVVFI